ncbi:hypothetical protein PIB30_007725 [Stylosanthes scabra]|uniref:Uncharacterized protein n=1 Tax=Stylosanthes scabra TaxID=79078 RepID=A0ABU6Y4Q1_9FABA|nr:hypothetical protein [Stylosanthes scabra]
MFSFRASESIRKRSESTRSRQNAFKDAILILFSLISLISPTSTLHFFQLSLNSHHPKTQNPYFLLPQFTSHHQHFSFTLLSPSISLPFFISLSLLRAFSFPLFSIFLQAPSSPISSSSIFTKTHNPSFFTSQTPNGAYQANGQTPKDERAAYEEKLSKLEIFPPRYVGEGVLPKDKYPEFWRLIDAQGLRPFLFWRERYYPRFVAAAFTTASLQDELDEEGHGDFYFNVSYVGRTYQFPLGHIAGAWGLRNKGTTFRGGNNPHGSWNEFDKVKVAITLRLEPAASSKYAVSKMTTDHRLLLYVLSYVLLPRKSNHGIAFEEDC